MRHLYKYKTIYCFVCVLTFTIISSALAGDKISTSADPISILKGIYGNFPEHESITSWHKADSRWREDYKRIPSLGEVPLSPEFNLVFARANYWMDKGEYCIDVNPFAATNGDDVVKYKINTPRSHNEDKITYKVDLIGTSSNDIRSVKYELIKLNNNWYIDNIDDWKADLDKYCKGK